LYRHRSSYQTSATADPASGIFCYVMCYVCVECERVLLGSRSLSDVLANVGRELPFDVKETTHMMKCQLLIHQSSNNNLRFLITRCCRTTCLLSHQATPVPSERQACNYRANSNNNHTKTKHNMHTLNREAAGYMHNTMRYIIGRVASLHQLARSLTVAVQTIDIVYAT
jgi:hypothetical protein